MFATIGSVNSLGSVARGLVDFNFDRSEQQCRPLGRQQLVIGLSLKR